MVTAAFRTLIALIVLIGAVNLVGSLTHFRDAGTFGFTTNDANGVGVNDTLTVGSVAPDSAAARAGVKRGDVLSYRSGFANRARLIAPVPGDAVEFSSGGRTFTLTAVTDEAPTPWALLCVAVASKLAFLIIASVVAWRRPNDSAALALALFLACFGAGIDYDFAVFAPLAIRFASFVFVQLAFVTGGASVLAFACWFPNRATSGIRRFISRLIIPFAVIGYVTTFGSFIERFVLSDARIGGALGTLYVFNYLAILVSFLVALVSSYREAEREQRARMRWVLGTFAIGFSGLLVLFVAIALHVYAQWPQYAALTVLAIPFGLGYVILRHRVIDIGFVINRAVVYTSVSLVVVGAFILFEWVLAHVVEENTRASAFIQLGGALALGLSVRFIHTRVDRFVDDLFFRDRHLAEAAIRRFTHETGLITDPGVLVKRTVEVTERHARVLGAGFYARLGPKYTLLHATFDGAAAEIDENDEAVLDMRTFHHPVDVGPNSAVPGFATFPMVVRGQLSGFLACGEKTTHEAFAPDERDALALLARAAGVALDSLRISRIEQELAYLVADGELPATLRMRLSSLIHRENGSQPAGLGTRSIQ